MDEGHRVVEAGILQVTVGNAFIAHVTFLQDSIYPKCAYLYLALTLAIIIHVRGIEAVCEIYGSIVDKSLTVRRFNVVVNRLLSIQEVKDQEENATPEQLSLFRDYAAEEQAKKEGDAALDKERRIQEALISIRDQYGKNAVVKGLNMQDGATAIERNETIGGHKK